MMSDESILAIDAAGRVGRVARFWPAFPAAVVKEFWRIWGGAPCHVRRHGDRVEDFVDRDPASRTYAEFLGWDEEVFEAAFQSALGGMVEVLWRTGQRLEVDERRELLAALPAAEWPLVLEASRVVRPRLPTPNETTEGQQQPTPLTDVAGHPGWYRLASWEEEVRTTALGSSVDATVRQAVRGVVGTGTAFQDVPLPVQSVRPERVEDVVRRPWSVRPVADCGLLAAFYRFAGPPGSGTLLVPTPAVARRLSLAPDPWPLPLTYRRPDGAAWACYRSWRARPARAGREGTAYQLVGCELLVHPDLLGHCRDAAGDLYELTTAW